MAGLRVGRPVGVLPATWPMGTQTPLATQALTMIIYTDDGLLMKRKDGLLWELP